MLPKSVRVCILVLIFSFAIFASPLAVVSAQPKFNPQAGNPRAPGPDIGSYVCSSSKTCPMGVADYGVNGIGKYKYVAEEFSSWVNFTKLAIGGNQQMTIQQNTVDYKVYENGIAGEYWIQDVPVIIQTSAGHFTIQLSDNIWNMSSPSAHMTGTIIPNLRGDCSSTGGQPKFYYCIGKQTVKTTLPFELKLLVQTGVVSSGQLKGSSVVTFAIHVYHSGVLAGGAGFDAVAFKGKAAVPARFQVGGANPYGLYNDAETVLAGNCCGSVATISSVSAHISESYSTTIGGLFTLVPHAWSAGSDTAETVSGVHMTSMVHGTGLAVSGADNNVQLW